MAKTRFTLVHGTFAANSTWLNQAANDNPDGFRAQLRAAFLQQTTGSTTVDAESLVSDDIEFSLPPAWGSTGLVKLKDLTNTARLTGATQLQQHILDSPTTDKHFLVAHSHGGNVAMYALQDPAVAARVDGLICMATPFLYPRKRPLSILALTLSWGIMLTGVMQFIWTSEMLLRGGLAWLGALCLVLFSIIVPAALTWLVAYERYQYRVKNDSRLSNLINKLSYQSPNIPILLIRASGDEASGLLRGAQFLNWLGGIGMRLGSRQLYILICAVALTLAWMGYRGSDMVPSFIIPLLTQGLMLSAAIMVLLLMALTISRVFVGFDAWRWVGEIETMVEDGPPGIASELVVVLPRSMQGLSHTGIYSDAETINSIVNWCRTVINRDEA